MTDRAQHVVNMIKERETQKDPNVIEALDRAIDLEWRAISDESPTEIVEITVALLARENLQP